jgi:hypothetical protein
VQRLSTADALHALCDRDAYLALLQRVARASGNERGEVRCG